MTAWNAGAALVNYCGHAGLNQLAAEDHFQRLGRAVAE